MTDISKTEIGRAVTALRELNDIIERLEKSTWPESQSDVLRKTDHLVEPQPMGDAASRALAALADVQRRVDELKAADAKRAEADALRKTWVVQQS